MKKDNKEKLVGKLISGVITANELTRLRKTLIEDGDESQLEIIEAMLSAKTELELPQVIDSAAKLSKAIFSDYNRAKKSPNKNRAIRVYDSSVMPLPEGVRPAAVESRLIKYKAGSYNIELSTYPVTVENYEIIGKIDLIENGDKINVILKNGKMKFESACDDYGLFRFESVTSGKYLIEIKKKSKVIGLIDVEL